MHDHLPYATQLPFLMHVLRERLSHAAEDQYRCDY